MQSEKSSSPPPALKSEHHKLIEYLDDFGRQISHRKSNSHTLEQQLSSLSRAYNQAQEKLLETEKALMSESILLQKQRTIIEIYKHIIRENMEDEGILGFIQNLQEDESKRDIYEELEEIKTILNRKRLNSFKKSVQHDRTFSELKKEIGRLHEERNNINDQSELVHSENYQLKALVDESKVQIKALKEELQKLRVAYEKNQRELRACSEELEKAKIEANRTKLLIQKSEDNEKAIDNLRVQLQEINCLLTERLNLNSQDPKENLQEASNRGKQQPSKLSQRQFLNQLDSKLSQLIKYKQQYKKLKENQQSNEFIKKQLAILKLFLSDEALGLLREYQLKQIDCIENQLRNLAAIEKNKLIRLEECERDVWKYKLQLMREEEGSLHSIPNVYLTQSLRPNLLGSVQNLRLLSQPVAKDMVVSTNPCQSVSDFVSQT